MRLHILLATLFVVVGSTGASADDPKPEVKGVDPPVKERRKFNGGGSESYEGVVTEIDKDTVMIDGKDAGGWGKKGTFKFYALDLHKASKVQEWADPAYSYRWQDVKVGDTIKVNVLRDRESSVRTPYAYEICIRRRPGEKLPASQQPKEDKERWQKDNFVNDIYNGEDKTDEEIMKMFPHHRDSRTKEIDFFGGLPQEHRQQLATLREKLAAEKEKKEKDLKAAPPDKK